MTSCHPSFLQSSTVLSPSSASVSLPSPSLPSFLAIRILWTLSYVASSFSVRFVLCFLGHIMSLVITITVCVYLVSITLATSYHFSSCPLVSWFYQFFIPLITNLRFSHPSFQSINHSLNRYLQGTCFSPSFHCTPLAKPPSLVKSNFLLFLTCTKQVNVAGKNTQSHRLVSL